MTEEEHNQNKENSQCLPDTVPLCDVADLYLEDIDKTSLWGQLLPVDGCSVKKDLSKDCYKVGRAPSCDVCITENMQMSSVISKVHFKVFRSFLDDSKANVVFLEDVSSNGTYINGKKVGRNQIVLLTSADEISLATPANKVFIFVNIAADQNLWLTSGLNSKYLVLKHLGSGGFGDVKLVVDKISLEKYAIKKLVKGVVQEKMITTEVNILRRLNHPCIIKLVDVIDTPECVYISLEFMPGGNLLSKLRSVNHFSEPNSKAILYQLVLAVKYLHDKGVTHRDLKPENILLSSPPASKKNNEKFMLVKVTDFGLSKVLDSMTNLKSTCGTLKYVAPEILLSKQMGPYSNKVDIWSLGIILYICLSGVYPFEIDDDEVALMQLICEGRYNLQHRVWNTISSQAKNVIHLMLKTNPKERIVTSEIIQHPWLKGDQVIERVNTLLEFSNSEMTEAEGSPTQFKKQKCF